MISELKGLFRQKCFAFLFLLVSLLTYSAYSSAQIVLDDEYVELNTWPTFAISPDERFLVIDRGRGEPGLKILNFRTKQVINEILLDEPGHISRCFFTSDGKYFISGDWNGVINIMHAGTFEIIRRWQAHEDVINSLIYFETDRLASFCRNREFTTWDLNTGESISHSDGISGERPAGVKYLPESEEFAAVMGMKDRKKTSLIFMCKNINDFGCSEFPWSYQFPYRNAQLNFIAKTNELWIEDFEKGKLYEVNREGKILRSIESKKGYWTYDMERIGENDYLLTINSGGHILLYDGDEIIQEIFIKKKRGHFGQQLLQLQLLENNRFAVSDESGTIRFYRLEE